MTTNSNDKSSSKTMIIVAIIGAMATIVAALGPKYFDTYYPIQTTRTAEARLTSVVLSSVPVISTATSFSPTETLPPGKLYTIRFVARNIPKEGGPYNVYVSMDNGVEKIECTASDQVDHTFSKIFSRSIRVWVDINPGQTLYEELWVNGEQIVVNEAADHNGLTYPVKP